MREAWQSIRDELLRRLSEGEDYISLSDETLNSIASNSESLSNRKKNDSKVSVEDNVSEIEFASDIKVEPQTIAEIETNRKIFVKNTGTSDFKIAPIPPAKSFVLPEGDKQTRWNALRDIVLNDPVCHEHLKPEKKVVFGVGNLDAKIFFCGEAPGADEEIQGEPFVGRAGQLLTKIIAAMGLTRQDVYIGNIMNWRPELPTSRGNRPPTEEEMAYCLPYLKAQIEIVNPQVIVALGGTAVNGLLGFDPNRKLGKIRGKWDKFEDKDFIATYHPSYLLQYASKSTKRLVWEDMLSVMERVGLPISPKQRDYFRE